MVNHYILAVALITCPDPSGRLASRIPTEVILRIAVDMEIIDPRQVGDLSREPDTCLSKIQCYYHNLRDCPHLVDCLRFPTKDFALSQMTFNREYHGLLKLSSIDYWQKSDLLREANRHHRFWFLVADCQDKTYYVQVRRQVLRELKTMLGDHAYWNGIYPAAVPSWRFRLID